MVDKVRFDRTDFDFQLDFYPEDNLAKVAHLKVSESHRRKGYGSVILETLKRIALTKEGIEKLEVSIGGGEASEEFLKRNGFEIIGRRQYEETYESDEGKYGVDAVYKYEWIRNDY
jgi:GNAT superfamily N-acetyltransferase